ncbi:MAG: hypothetical protein HY960_12755 [Ignavibacteriae bacterium]|nr:hypothetical protein [Ignavibacteriota bacterium]
MALYMVVDFFASLIQWILAEYKLNNLWTMHYYLPLQYGFTVWVLSSWLRTTEQRVARYSIPVFTSIWLIVFVTIEEVTRLSVVNKPVESALLVFLSMYVIFFLNKEARIPLLSHPGFLFSSLTLVYFIGVMMLFLLGNNILTVSTEVLGQAWMIQSIVGIMKNVGYSVALVVPASTKETSV